MLENNIELFHSHVQKNGGYILSDGVLSVDVLLGKVYDFINIYELETELREEILSLFEVDIKSDLPLSLDFMRYHNEARMKQDCIENANYILNEKVYDYFNEIAPDGYYYGSSDGDMSLIGWFEVEQEEY